MKYIGRLKQQNTNMSEQHTTYLHTLDYNHYMRQHFVVIIMFDLVLLLKHVTALLLHRPLQSHNKSLSYKKKK